MRKIVPLIFSILSSLAALGQASGGWGTCEFTTVAAMNAYDPSGSNFSCKKVYVQATDEHYQWDGASWVLTQSEDNIYNADDTLTSNRVLEGNSNNLTLTGIATFIASAATSTFRATANILYEADKDANATGEHQFYTGSTEQMTIENAGTIDLLQYGDGTYEDNVNNTFDLAVDGSGNVIEVDRRVSKIYTTTLSFSSNQNDLTLTGLTAAPYYEVYRLNPTADIDVTGINATGVIDGQRLTLLNISSSNKIKIKNEDTNSTAANRFICENLADEDLRKGGAVTLIYDATSSRWRIFAVNRAK